MVAQAQCARRGVTLIEMILVVALAGIVTAIAMPRYGRSLERYRADAAARRVAADLNLAASRARAVSASQTVTFTPAADRYQIVGMADMDHSTAVHTVELGSGIYRARLVSATCGTDSDIIFSGYGVPDSGAMIIVRSGSEQRMVTVDPDSGLASVQ